MMDRRLDDGRLMGRASLLFHFGYDFTYFRIFDFPLLFSDGYTLMPPRHAILSVPFAYPLMFFSLNTAFPFSSFIINLFGLRLTESVTVGCMVVMFTYWQYFYIWYCYDYMPVFYLA